MTILFNIFKLLGKQSGFHAYTIYTLELERFVVPLGAEFPPRGFGYQFNIITT
jgi:hypothetical protein